MYTYSILKQIGTSCDFILFDVNNYTDLMCRMPLSMYGLHYHVMNVLGNSQRWQGQQAPTGSSFLVCCMELIQPASM